MSVICEVEGDFVKVVSGEFRPPPKHVRLTAGEVHMWMAVITPTVARPERFIKMLSVEEA
jgi:hypothetical protein